MQMVYNGCVEATVSELRDLLHLANYLRISIPITNEIARSLSFNLNPDPAPLPRSLPKLTPRPLPAAASNLASNLGYSNNNILDFPPFDPFSGEFFGEDLV
jgi:hypothetical protein